MDTVIFSGRVSKTEMLHERARWYDRLVAEGRLDEHRVRDEWLRWKNIARSFGYFFFGLGDPAAGPDLYAMITRLTHRRHKPGRGAERCPAKMAGMSRPSRAVVGALPRAVA